MRKWLADIIVRLLVGASDSQKRKLFSVFESQFRQMQYDYFRQRYDISDGFRFNGPNINFYGNGRISCGSNSYIGSYSSVQAAEGFAVTIGENCSISHNVRIYTSSNKTDQDMNHTRNKEKVFGDVSIGNGVWIGANVFIRENVRIADNVVVGANSVVTSNLDENGIYGGVPAKLIRFKTQQ